jgi:serine/threonine-protein phosphatase 2B catalytic subunit
VREYLAREGTLTKPHVTRILRDSAALISKEPNLIRVPEPIVVVGDIHGQYYDLLNLLKLNGPPDND